MGNSNNTINKIENINGPSNVDFSNHSSIIFIEYEKATIKISLNLSESISQLKKHIEEIIGVKKKTKLYTLTISYYQIILSYIIIS